MTGTTQLEAASDQILLHFQVYVVCRGKWYRAVLLVHLLPLLTTRTHTASAPRFHVLTVASSVTHSYPPSRQARRTDSVSAEPEMCRSYSFNV